MTFFLTPIGDNSYDRVMKELMEKSLFFSKEGATIEVEGSNTDYEHFKMLAESGQISAYVDTV